MPRLAGVDIPEDKPVWVSLTYIYGIGETSAREIIEKAGISEGKRGYDLSEDQISQLNSIIERDYKIEGELRQEVRRNIQRLKDIDCYRGIRHKNDLPVRGQRTQSNARTQKGERKTVPGRDRTVQKPGG